MSQDFDPPVAPDNLEIAINKIADSLHALNSLHSGTGAPSSPTALQIWADTTNKVLRQWDSVGTSWVIIGPLLANSGLVSIPAGKSGDGLSASTIYRFPAIQQSMTIVGVSLLPDTSTTSSVAASKEWTFALTNLTQALSLYSATPSTATSVSGVGGGVEFTGDSPYALDANQNMTATVGDVFDLTVTRVGSSETQTEFLVNLIGYIQGS